jgi:hypothetical protein
MLSLRRQFFAYCQTVLDARPMTASERAALNVVVWLYASKRVYKIRRYVREQLRALVASGAGLKIATTRKI